MRTKNSFMNLLMSWGAMLVNVILNFGIRTIFIHILSTEYLGMNGLFSNILMFLSFTELGFGTAITFSLYKPIADNDEIHIAGIMNFFKKVYIMVGSMVFIIGIGLAPFLHFLIKDMPDIPDIYLIYFLWILNTAISYFLTYKATLIIAYQKKYIVTRNEFIFNVITMLLQIAALVITRNYISYLLLKIAGTLFTNLCNTYVANKSYPYLKRYKDEKIDRESLAEIKKNVSATIMHKLGAVIIFGTDNVLLSKLFGLAVVGIYSNYYLVIDAVKNLAGQIQISIMASVGNMGVTSSYKKKQEIFEEFFFLLFWVFAFSSACLFSLLNPFIDLWIGKSYEMPIYVIAVLVFNFFLNGIRSAAAMFDNAFGFFWNTRFLPVIESFLNLTISILLALKFGYIGVFLGTAISSLISGAWFEPFVLYKKGFHNTPKRYYILLTKYIAVAIALSYIISIIVNKVALQGIFGFILQCFIAGIGSNILLFLLYCRSSKKQYIYDMIGRVYKIIKR